MKLNYSHIDSDPYLERARNVYYQPRIYSYVFEYNRKRETPIRAHFAFLDNAWNILL